MKLINEEQVLDKWAPIVTEATDLDPKKDGDKVRWISQYAHLHEMNHIDEDVATKGNTPGMGDTRLPLHGPDLTSTDDGSGDLPTDTLAMSMQVAATTIGFDLVPVVPMDSNITILTYADKVYADGRIDNEDHPAIVTITGKTAADIGDPNAGDTVDVAAATDTDLNAFSFEFLGTSRIEGTPILRVTNAAAGKTLSDLAADGTAAVGGATFDGESFKLVAALDNHITGFTGSDWGSNAPYTRGEGESSKNRTMGLTLFSKTVEAGTYQVDGQVTWEQQQDIPRNHGWDPVAQIESTLMNELSQSLNKYILERLFTLAMENVANAPGLGLDTLALKPLSSLQGGQTELTEKRRIFSRITAISNFIANKGRRGPATYVVTNARIGSILQDISSFREAPVSNSITMNSGSLYPLGSVSNLNIYVDPNMGWDDDRVLVGSKGDGNKPGLVFMPYIMADSVQIVAEGTMASKVAVKTRFALVDAGFHPEVYYYLLDVTGAEQYV